jgi:hypothetical protein
MTALTAAHCQRKAEECGRLTLYMKTPQTRVALANVERTWLRLADQCQQLENLIKMIEQPHITIAS